MLLKSPLKITWNMFDTNRLEKCQIVLTMTTAQNDVIDTPVICFCHMLAAWLVLKVNIICFSGKSYLN